MASKKQLLKMAAEIESLFASLDIKDSGVIDSFASTLVAIKNAADQDIEASISDKLDAIAALAAALDQTGDPVLMKEAEELDAVLLTLAAPEAALAAVNSVYDADLENLRVKHRHEQLDEKYNRTREALDLLHNRKAVVDAVNDQVKVRRPLEDALSTRYSPDRPGVSLLRISDGVYQDPTTGKIFDYNNGYTTDKGNFVPGTSLHQQSYLASQRQGRSAFTTRQNYISNPESDDIE